MTRKRKPIKKSRVKGKKLSKYSDEKPPVMVQVDTVPRIFYMISRADPKSEPKRVYATIIGPKALKYQGPRHSYNHNFDQGILISKDKLFTSKEAAVRAQKLKPAWILEYGKIIKGYTAGKGHETSFVTMEGKYQWGEKIYKSEAAVTQAYLRELKKKVASSKSSFRQSERKLMAVESRLSILKRQAAKRAAKGPASPSTATRTRRPARATTRSTT
jgi:hypothetical protein